MPYDCPRGRSTPPRATRVSLVVVEKESGVPCWTRTSTCVACAGGKAAAGEGKQAPYPHDCIRIRITHQAPQRVRAHGEGRQSGFPSPSPPTCGSGMAPPHHCCCCCGCQPLAGMTLGQGGGCWGCGRIGSDGAGCGKRETGDNATPQYKAAPKRDALHALYPRHAPDLTFSAASRKVARARSALAASLPTASPWHLSTACTSAAVLDHTRWATHRGE